jgi:hypothetical protein
LQKIYYFFILALLNLVTVGHAKQVLTGIDPDRQLLPEKFPIFTSGNVVVGIPESGFAKKVIPVVNAVTSQPGCYLACYSPLNSGIYALKPGVYLHGLVRVAGKYHAHLCQPLKLASQDLNRINDLCFKNIETCHTANSHCWAVGDTKGWFNISVMSGVDE